MNCRFLRYDDVTGTFRIEVVDGERDRELRCECDSEMALKITNMNCKRSNKNRSVLRIQLLLMMKLETSLHESCAESSVLSSPGTPNILRLRSIEPTAMYLESSPNLTHVALPARSWIYLQCLHNRLKQKKRRGRTMT